MNLRIFKITSKANGLLESVQEWGEIGERKTKINMADLHPTAVTVIHRKEVN